MELNSREKKRKEKILKELQEKIREKEIDVQKSRKKKKKIVELKLLQELNNYINKQIERRNKIFKQKEFQGANKPGRFLAWQIKKRREKKFIVKIQDKGREIFDQKGI